MEADEAPKQPYDGSDVFDEDINSKLVAALKQLQLQRNRKEIEMQQKIKETMDEFDAKRRAIVTGAHVPTEEECKYELAGPTSPEPTEPIENGIPHFWSVVLHNLKYFAKLISNDDENVLMHLIDVRCVNLEDPRGFKLEFEFSENEWFNNKVLTVEYLYREDSRGPLQFEDRTVNRMVGCTIDWKPGKDATHNKELDDYVGSFLDIFDPLTDPIDHDSYEADERVSLLAAFKAGQLMRDKVIPRAIIYFTDECYDDEVMKDDVDEEEEEEEDLGQLNQDDDEPNEGNDEVDEEEDDDDDDAEESEDEGVDLDQPNEGNDGLDDDDEVAMNEDEEEDEEEEEDQLNEDKDDLDDDDDEDSKDDSEPASKKFKGTGPRGGSAWMAN